MLVAKGLITGKIYAQGENRAAVLRQLDKEYPYSSRSNPTEFSGKVFPEVLQIRKG
ncbi:hypothetical protein [Gracilibacillus salinarum]|uniref:Uncharacterized protein n=1 Tax=Gracilibacillus salinarum TaxID=2932255 RepID=A0ABY4GNA3_9BACI|nr:hypothetical protein [Gracilibacillus salinarum]UOQ85666.1 hypothetical protein MUN87_01805 [Gracilibacillus salinarum]